MNVALVTLNATAVAPQKPLPTMTTDVPVPPVSGENDVIVGATAGVTTWKLDALVPLPSASTTTSRAVPVEHRQARWSSIWCRLGRNDRRLTAPGNVTAVTAAPAVNPVPVMVTDVPRHRTRG